MNDSGVFSNIPHMVHPGGRLKVEHADSAIDVRVRGYSVKSSRIVHHHSALTAD